jgi:hypothetical protein
MPDSNYVGLLDEEASRSRKQKSKPTSSKKVTNENFNSNSNSNWKVTNLDAIGFCINRLVEAQICQNNKPTCFRWHSTGVCSANCKLKASHKTLNDANTRKYSSFFKKACLTWKKQCDENEDSEPELKCTKREDESSA